MLRFSGTDAKRDSFVYRQVAVGINTMRPSWSMPICEGGQTRVLFRHTIVHMSMIIQKVLRLTSYQQL